MSWDNATYPLRYPGIRRACAHDDRCPECGGELDTGWECNSCGYDAKDEATADLWMGSPMPAQQ